MTAKTRTLPAVDGHYLRHVLDYVMLACPKPTKDDDSLSHLIFTTDLDVVAVDGDRYHVGHLPATPGLVIHRSFGVSRGSVECFLKLLKASCAIVGKTAPIPVYLDLELDGEPGLEATIECMGERWRWSFTRAVFLGPIADSWISPVPEDAQPILAPPSALRGQHLSQATSIAETVATTRQAVEGGPVRVDLSAHVKSEDEQMVVATAVLLPVGTRARLLDNKQKEAFAKENPGQDPGRSVLSMVIDGPRGIDRPGYESAAAQLVREMQAQGVTVTVGKRTSRRPVAS